MPPLDIGVRPLDRRDGPLDFREEPWTFGRTNAVHAVGDPIMAGHFSVKLRAVRRVVSDRDVPVGFAAIAANTPMRPARGRPASGRGSPYPRSNADLHERMETLESNGDLIGYRSEPVDRDEIGIARAIASVRS